MFGLNGSSNGGDLPTQGSLPASPMVPNGDGIDQPVPDPPTPPNPQPTAPTAPPMPSGPATDLAVPEDPLPLDSPADMAAATPATPVVNDQVGDDLIKLKQEALQSLAPLVDQLDQTPEERFKTTMMMLQASDNPELVKEAYAAANAISDEKVRAQALLDVVNEINYFTQHAANSSQVA